MSMTHEKRFNTHKKIEQYNKIASGSDSGNNFSYKHTEEPERQRHLQPNSSSSEWNLLSPLYLD